MIGDMVITGSSERTRQAYARAVRLLVEFYDRRVPDELTEGDVKADLRWMRVEKEAAAGTLRIAIGGLRFFTVCGVRTRRTCWKRESTCERRAAASWSSNASPASARHPSHTAATTNAQPIKSASPLRT